MKSILLSVVITSFIFAPLFSQNEDKTEKLENLENKCKKKDAKDTASVVPGNEIFSIRGSGDETRITLGNKEYRVVEDNESLRIYKHDKRDRNSGFYQKRYDRFRGHLGGMELGINGFRTDSWSTSLATEDNYFDLNTAKSNVWNFMLPNLNIGITRHFGLAASLGINLNNYRFDHNNTIAKDALSMIGPLYPEPGIIYTKSKFHTTYAILPVIMEIQIPVNDSYHKTVNISGGFIGAVKLWSHTKVKWDAGSKQKAKLKDDFSLNALRWGATARIGYENFQVFGTTYFTPMFEKGRGPELFPFEVGIALTFN